MNLKNQRTKEIFDAKSRVLSQATRFDIVESYKSIRTSIMFSLPKTELGKVIMVTGSAPNEGKTVTSINLAISFAQIGAKVLIVDCDLRKSRIHRYLNIENKVGLTNILCGYAELGQAIAKGVKENLDVLPAGEIPPNPAELLVSSVFADVIKELREKYDYIFIDTPPVTVVTDAMIVAKHSDGVVVTVRENQTSYDDLDKTIDSLKNAKVKILGAVVLGSLHVNKRHSRRYKYGYRYQDNSQ